jgi:hypothetical protein
MAYNILSRSYRLSRAVSSGKLGLGFTIILFATIALLPSCKPEHIDEGAQLKYFDLKAYFKAESAKLKSQAKTVVKTVNHNKVKETKSVTINNWESELSLFTASDINKPAWRENYRVKDNGDIVVYEAKDPDLKTREIIINKPGNKVKWILVFNSTENMLYQTTEKLSYFPDSAYVIAKTQHVRLLGTNQYKITGLLR